MGISKKMLAFAALGAVCLFGGCQKNQEIKIIDRICLANSDPQRLMDISRMVLAKINFAIDKYDSEKLYISTRPLAGGQFFEFWRKDNVGAFNNIEANLHSIRRTAEIEITENNGQLCCVCNVTVERLSLSQRPEYSSAIEYDRFTGQSVAVSAQSLELTAGVRKWIELGNDEMLASVILHKIQNQF